MRASIDALVLRFYQLTTRKSYTNLDIIVEVRKRKENGRKCRPRVALYVTKALEKEKCIKSHQFSELIVGFRKTLRRYKINQNPHANSTTLDQQHIFQDLP